MHVIRAARKNELQAALHALLYKPGTSASELRHQVDALSRHASKHQLSLEHCQLAEDQGRILSACLCVDSPGRTASIFLPNHISTPAARDAVVAMLNEQIRTATDRGICLIQGMTVVGGDIEQQLFSRAGFQQLTELIYLERDVTRPIPPGLPSPKINWDEYSSANHADFAKVVQGTYLASMDCAALSGIRDIEDTLASHRATGEFDAKHWLLARADDTRIGVLLLSRIAERSSVEGVYMGLLPESRGHGYGMTLLRRALDVARQQGVSTLTLSVDVQNMPARKVYASFGFYEVSRRDVWMRILGTSS